MGLLSQVMLENDNDLVSQLSSFKLQVLKPLTWS